MRKTSQNFVTLYKKRVFDVKKRNSSRKGRFRVVSQIKSETAGIFVQKKGEGVLYRVLGDDQYRNCSTGVKGEIKKQLADQFLELPVRVNAMNWKNNRLGKLIEVFGCEVCPSSASTGSATGEG